MTLEMSAQEFELDTAIVDQKVKRQKQENDRKQAALELQMRKQSSINCDFLGGHIRRMSTVIKTKSRRMAPPLRMNDRSSSVVAEPFSFDKMSIGGTNVNSIKEEILEKDNDDEVDDGASVSLSSCSPLPRTEFSDRKPREKDSTDLMFKIIEPTVAKKQTAVPRLKLKINVSAQPE